MIDYLAYILVSVFPISMIADWLIGGPHIGYVAFLVLYGILTTFVVIVGDRRNQRRRRNVRRRRS